MRTEVLYLQSREGALDTHVREGGVSLRASAGRNGASEHRGLLDRSPWRGLPRGRG